MTHPLVLIARLFDFVRETQGPNRGVWVELFLKYTDNKPGDSWCCAFVCFLLSIYYKGGSPFTKTASCQNLLDQLRKLGCERAVGMPGDLFFYLDGVGHAHHVGVLTATGPYTGIAGNTSPDGKSDNGTGVFEHTIGGKLTFGRLPIRKAA